MIRKTVREFKRKQISGLEPEDIILREVWYFLFIPIYIRDSFVP